MRAVIALMIVAGPIVGQTPPNIGVPPPGGRSFQSLIPLQGRAETGDASIEGTVVDALTHNPVKKANVHLNGRDNLNAVTDADGRFVFRQLLAGQYVIQAQAEKYPIAQFSLETGRQVSVSVKADEQKTGVTLSLTPGASVRGRVVDEEGSPMPQCTVSAMRRSVNDTGPSLMGVGGTPFPSDEKGEYHIQNIPAGKYYLQARCPQAIPMPHAFVPRDALASLPTLTYPPLFYPGSAEPAGAAKVSLTPGADLSGMDFQMTPATGVGLRGRIRPVLSSPNLFITLRPDRKELGPAQQMTVRPDPATGEFRFVSVRPGSYVLAATAEVDGRSYFAKTAVEVGASAPEPVDLALQPLPQINGSISIEGDAKIPFKNLRISIFPIDERPVGPLPQSEGQVTDDGSFVGAAFPGRSRLQVNGAPGYIKSVMLGDQEVSPSGFEIGPVPGPLKIVIGTKYAQVNATIAGIPADAGPVMGSVWSTDASPFQSIASMSGPGPSTLSVPPGRYYACALAAAQPGMLLQDRAFRKALEGHCQTVEASENSPATVQMPFISADEVKRLIDALDADDAPAF